MKDDSSEISPCERSFCSGAAPQPQQLLPIVEMLLSGGEKKKQPNKPHPNNLTTHADDIYAKPCSRVREIKDKARNKRGGRALSPCPARSRRSLFAELLRSSCSLCPSGIALFSFYTAQRFLWPPERREAPQDIGRLLMRICRVGTSGANSPGECSTPGKRLLLQPHPWMLPEPLGGTWGCCLIKGKASLDCSLGDWRAAEAPGWTLCTRTGLGGDAPGEPRKARGALGDYLGFGGS